MSLTRMVDRATPRRARVERYDKGADDYVEVYANIPCRVVRHRHVENTQDYAKTSDTELPFILVNRVQKNGVTLDIRLEDEFCLDNGESYRILSVSDEASALHHFKLEAERLKTMRTSD